MLNGSNEHSRSPPAVSAANLLSDKSDLDMFL